MTTKIKLSDHIKDESSYKKFVAAYMRLLKEVNDLEADQAVLHKQILQAIDHKKMNKVLSYLKKIEDKE